MRLEDFLSVGETRRNSKKKPIRGRVVSCRIIISVDSIRCVGVDTETEYFLLLLPIDIVTMPILNTPKSVRIKYSKHGKDGQQAQAYRFKRFFRAYFGSALKVRRLSYRRFDVSVLNENPQTHRSNWIRMMDMEVYSV